MILPETGERAAGKARSGEPGGARHIVANALGLILVAVVLVAVAVAFEGSSWWYHDLGDRPLDDESRTSLQAVRDEVAAAGAAPEAVMWLDAALDTDADPSALRDYLLAAQEALEAAADPVADRAAQQLTVTIERIDARGSSIVDTTGAPYALPTLPWSE